MGKAKWIDKDEGWGKLLLLRFNDLECIGQMVVELAVVPKDIRKGVWVRLSLGDYDAVMDRRAVTQLRDTLTDILDGRPLPGREEGKG